MHVRNAKCIRKLSIRSLWGQRKRNLVAVAAIVLTTLLFTALFTVVLSINASYQTYQFRQLGGDSHGTFKDVTEEQIREIGAHRLVRQTGVRTVIGIASEGVFAKEPAEISYMDENCTRWSYAEPTAGRLPAGGKEITMDTKALSLLGVTPEAGAQVPLTFQLTDKIQNGPEVSDVFTLVGWWDYDGLMPVHYLNVSADYVKEMAERGREAGMKSFRTDLNVMMASSVDIRGQMERVDTDLGYSWEENFTGDSVRIGVNWGYTTAQFSAGMDAGSILAILAFLVLVILTGYLIIYNIFQISVAGDIRYYGLLKTIGVTSRQLRRLIRIQALTLCAAGIPLGLLLGYGVGWLVMPAVLSASSLGESVLTVSASPLIFAASALFSLATVLISCAKPGRQAGKVSPVEASRYTEKVSGKRKTAAARGAKVRQMALANLGRNRSKTALVVISLALSVILLNCLILFVRGFDMETYLSAQSCADFIVSSPDYFRVNLSVQEYLPEETVAQLRGGTETSLSGLGYRYTGASAVWMPEETWLADMVRFYGSEQAQQMLEAQDRRDGKIPGLITLEGLDVPLMDKLTVIAGDLAPLKSSEGHFLAIAADVDDYGNVMNAESYPAVGETLTLAYAPVMPYVDSRTGELCDESTPPEFLRMTMPDSRETEYTVCALVEVPRSMSLRYSTSGYMAVLNAETLERDSGEKNLPLFYLFDTPDEKAEADAEQLLAEMSADPLSPVMYESKASLRAEFENFRRLFLLLGGVLCAVIALVGVLNFLNAVMTGILSRRREFAVLQAVGMTNRQLRTMLICEGLFYALASGAAALLLSLLLNPLAGKVLETFWFFRFRFTILPVLAAVPVFAALGYLVPALLYGSAVKQSVVERLRTADQ